MPLASPTLESNYGADEGQFACVNRQAYQKTLIGDGGTTGPVLGRYRGRVRLLLVPGAFELITDNAALCTFVVKHNIVVSRTTRWYYFYWIYRSLVYVLDLNY